ncbi:MAG: bifunctional (p)ppGpp synthetase/guanosine-3',5'-bis(diphosphate) 3'-pyrophosphohydrolase [Eubacteriales bacterium]|nr:bifunctional (p)ppGpp synthetase/guanosine-3',5'-bis(diphosphate) 3'-pyrophosphohydrolase [Eubacteriales bacterium]
MDPMLHYYNELERHVLSYNPALDKALLYKAYCYAAKAHEGQTRKDGSPYITHPLAVANIVADLKLDTDSLCAALLHDCIEDTKSTHEDISREFSPIIADLVEGVTKLTRINYVSMEEKQMENLRKMLMAMSKDIRVILVKLCDRLHNMRTMQYQTPAKQREKSRETLEIYAPIAHRLGMQRIKWELEDLSLKYLDPIGYQEIEDALAKQEQRNKEFMVATKVRIQHRMEDESIHCTITSRIKHIYSIYRKMFAQQKTLGEIFDLCAFRVIVDDIPDCYNVLGLIHDMYNPVPGRFKDYISTPKPNLYQSLHTTVIGTAGIPFEVQIRTWEMHETAEYGVAAHWKYKEGLANSQVSGENTFEWVRRLLESQEDTDAEEFVGSLKVDLFSDQVFVFTPQGEVKGLPAGSTPIDFAYSIHSAVGNHMTGAKINGRIVPFETKLSNGDIVEILTSKSAKGPSRDWMKLCKSNEARNKIRQWFKKERRADNIIHGRSAFESELKRAGFSMTMISSEENLPRLLKKLQYSTLEDLYAAIGYGGMTALKAVNRIRNEILQINKERKEQNTVQELVSADDQTQTMHIRTSLPPDPPPAKKRYSKNGIIVDGLDNCLVKFAKCCTPVPGDPVVGFITRGYGVSVHRQDCPNASPEKQAAEKGRWVPVSWSTGDLDAYQTTLELSAKDRSNLFLDVAATLSAAKIRVDSITAKGTPDGFAIVTVLISVRNREELDMVTKKLSSIRDVLGVRRAKG